MTGDTALLFVPIGDNPARPFGMGARERACRVAQNAGLTLADASDLKAGALLASMDYSWDREWLDVLKDRPNGVLTLAGKPVIVNLAKSGDADAAIRALDNGVFPQGYEEIPADGARYRPSLLKKPERPFVLALDPVDPNMVERAIYDAANRGPSDFLTLLLRLPLFHFVRAAARARLPAIAVTLLGAIFGVLAFICFWRCHYWIGIAAGFIVIVLDRLQRQISLCTARSSKLDDILGQGIEIVFPPFWWWAWLHGLEAYGRRLEPVYATMILIVILGGYLGELAIEVRSIQRFNGMVIHAWRPLDSRFRLIAAGPSSNLLILAGALLFRRPDTGLALVAWWTLISLIFHWLRLAQMTERKARGGIIKSWLDA